MNTKHWKNEAQNAGISWDILREAYAELRGCERQAVERLWESRMTAWAYLPCPSAGAFKSKYRASFEGGDYDSIPGFDDVAKELANTEIPELGSDDPAASLWELISEPKRQLPPADDTMAEAFDLALERAADVVPF